jgi:uncharacterized protein
VLFGSYPAGPNRVVSAVVIAVTLTAFAFVLARLRFQTGSVWPVVIAHAAWNSIILDSFEGSTPAATMWTRETGVLVAAATVLCAALVTRGAWSMRRDPFTAPHPLETEPAR